MGKDKSHKAPAYASDEAERILICARLVGLHHEREALSTADNWAPDSGPLHPRYEATCRKESELRRRLNALGVPSTTGGIAALAILAVTKAPRDRAGAIMVDCEREMHLMAVAQSVAHTNEPMTMSEEGVA